MYENRPDMAKQWEADTPKGAALPEHVSAPRKTRAKPLGAFGNRTRLPKLR
jgi:hypothetical protein